MGAKRILYYADRRGRDPVWEELQALPPQEREKVEAYIFLLRESGEELRRPVADYVGDKLYELRPGPYRVLYFFFLKENVVLLHLFRKRSDRLLDWEKRVALNRMADIIRRDRLGRVMLREET